MLIISNGGAIARHSKTGRQLNQFKHTQQYSIAEINHARITDILQHVKRAQAVELKYKGLTKVSPNKATLDTVLKLILCLLIYPNRIMSIDSLDIGITRPTRTAIINKLEKLGLIEVYQGFSVKDGGGRPMGIKPTNELLTYKC
jgi:DNA-binding MarR family transcriptional regulator